MFELNLSEIGKKIKISIFLRFDFKEKEKIRFSITRIAFPDNSSHYKINERQVSLKEVTKLLREYGVDLDHSRYLILQVKLEENLCRENYSILLFHLRATSKRSR